MGIGIDNQAVHTIPFRQRFEAEKVLKAVGPKNGFEVTCYRWTNDTADPKFKKYQEDFRGRTGLTVEPEGCGRVNAQALKNFDAVLFFTTGNPLTKAELKGIYRRLATLKKILEPGQKKIKGFFNFRMDLGK